MALDMTPETRYSAEMNLLHYCKQHPFGSLFPEFDSSFYPTLLSMECKEESNSEKKYLKTLTFTIVE